MSDRLPIDSGDALLDGCATGVLRPLGRGLLYLTSLWLGGTLAATALRLGEFFDGFAVSDLFRVPRAVLDGAEWILVGFVSSAFPLTCAGAAFFLFTNRELRWWWFASVVVQGAIFLGMDEAPPLIWLPWLLLCSMVGSAVWFGHAWFHNRWAREMATLDAENAARIAARERAVETGGESEEAENETAESAGRR